MGIYIDRGNSSIVDAMVKRLIADIRTAYPKVAVPRGGRPTTTLLGYAVCSRARRASRSSPECI